MQFLQLKQLEKCCECDTLATKQSIITIIIITVIQGGPTRWKDPDCDLLCQRGTTIMYARHLRDVKREVLASFEKALFG